MEKRAAVSYDAFLSYSHSIDAELAPELQRLICRVGRPWYRRSSLHVFRDSTSLTLASGLRASIMEALSASRHFILLASPDAARSSWVQEEISRWRSSRDPSTFFIVLTEGTIEWDVTRGDFDWARTTALPEQAIAGWFRAEPLWEDVRAARGKGQRDRLRDAARTLAAPMYGIRKDELDSEDEREARRGRRFLRGGILSVAVLLIVAVVAASLAVRQGQSADDRQRLAIARSLLTRGEAAMNSDPGAALRLGEAAYRINPDRETQDGLAQLLLRTRYTSSLIGHTASVESVAFSPDGHTLAAGSEDHTVLLWDLHDPAQPRQIGNPLTGHTGAVNTLTFTPDGHTLASGSTEETSLPLAATITRCGCGTCTIPHRPAPSVGHSPAIPAPSISRRHPRRAHPRQRQHRRDIIAVGHPRPHPSSRDRSARRPYRHDHQRPCFRP